MSALPILDLTPFREDESSATAGEFITALRDICHTVGFFHLTGHGVPDELNQRVHQVSREFFALPEPDRLAISMENSPHFRGYTPPGGEHTNGRPDLRDEIDLGPEAEPMPVGPGDPAWRWLRGPNQWPAGIPGFRETVTTWMEEMDRLGHAVLRALALALGQPAMRFAEWLDPTPEATAKLVRYLAPSAEFPTGQGVGLHRDFGLLTFVYQDTVGGLQVERDGDLVDVPVIPGTLVVNLGEMLQLATHGYLKATVHRVVSPPVGVERISSVYFVNPRLDATLSRIDLPGELAAEAPGGESSDPSNPIFTTYGENILKVRLRAHPAVTRRHHADLVGAAN
ncbi:isopenicillin N synthase family dioxygenase [Protofrankia symbiont of Coriaria ruscifolia]|uniref:isopenicillin N synthase family dioxygenase n=1 Tax=Protofrankia symbiont of Coriaria ruscifolia TaxID=1306542 RepID=UPI001041B4D6|nr:2-oxoglutarate and iron-dependent oxygenase domain-containing protein [Protofrankia symbiont of Coriaria ruscifolia]